MELGFKEMMEWFEDNKDWLLIPLIVNFVVVLIGFILLLVTGKDVNFIIKILFVILILGAPFLGYFIGEYIDPYLAPLLEKIKI
jgi:hypothetical protein